MPPVRVVVVTYSPGRSLCECLASLPAACSVGYDVVLANNGPVDEYVRELADSPGVRLLQTGGNVGYGRAANLGADAPPSTAWLLVCNPDVTFEPRAVDELLDAARRWPRAGSLGPAVLDPDGTVYPSARALPRLGPGVGHSLLSPIWPGNPWTKKYQRRDFLAEEGPAGWLSGSCLLLRREAWESVGGFDPAYFMYFEDVDLGDRLSRAGWQNVYVPSARITHIGGASTGRDAAAMLRAHHESASRYIADRYPRFVASLVRFGLHVRLRVLAARR